MIMKRLLNLFFTAQAKTVIALLIVICSWLMNSELTAVFSLYKEDGPAVTNVFAQQDDFNYESSYFLKHEIETAIKDVLEYSLVYHRNENNSTNSETSAETISYLAENFVKHKTVSQVFIEEGFIELTPAEKSNETVEIDGVHYIQSVNYDKIQSSDNSLDFDEFYLRASDDSYAEIAKRLESFNDFRFALVNHKTDTIVSNISAINGKGTDLTVRRYFGDDKNILIVRDAKTPYFENGTMSEYVPFVSEQAKKYTDDFDVYISFGESLEFAGTSEEYSQKHEFAFSKIKSALKDISSYLVVLFIMFLALIAVSGKRELKGKYYPSLTDRLPNDIKLLLHSVVYISMSALYENSLYMTLRVTNIENYWFNITPEFYLLRSNICMVVMICIITAFFCTIKRQLGCGTLVTNSYIYKIVKSYKKAEPEA